MENYTSQYSTSELDELKYLISEGFYTSLPQAIALDIFHSSDLEDISVFKKFFSSPKMKFKNYKTALLSN